MTDREHARLLALSQAGRWPANLGENLAIGAGLYRSYRVGWREGLLDALGDEDVWRPGCQRSAP